MRATTTILTFTTLLLWAAAARAQETPPAPDCSTPRRAAVTWLGNLQQGQERPGSAIECFDWAGAGVRGAMRAQRARELKRVLDVGGDWVKVDELPDTLDAEGAQRVPLFSDERLPELYFVRKDGNWVMSAHSIQGIPQLVHDTLSVDVESFVDELPAWLRAEVIAGFAWWQLLGVLIAIFFSLLVRALVAFVVAKYGARLILRRGGKADQTIVVKAARPIGTIAMAGVLWYVLPLLRLSVRVSMVANAGVRILAAVSAVIVLYRIVDLISEIFARRAEKTDTKLDDQLVPLVRKTLKVFVVVIGVIFVLQNMDVDVTSLLALGTVGGLAFSFAAQDTVANLFGSVSIFADRPFQVGDWVVIGDTEGIVEEVGMRSTRIRTFYNSVVTLPNSVIVKTPVDNYGERKFRRTSVTIGLTYDTTPEQMHAFCDGLRAIIQANPTTRKDYYEVHFKGFGDSGLEVMLYFFFKTDTWSEELRQRHNVYLEILRLADELGVAFAFPTRTVHVVTRAEPQAIPRHGAPPKEALRDAVLRFAPGGTLARPGGPTITAGFMAGSEHGGDGEGGSRARRLPERRR